MAWRILPILRERSIFVRLRNKIFKNFLARSIFTRIIRKFDGGGGLFDDIKSGSPVVLIGLPCNIATVMSTLQSQGIEHRNLITIDMVCGGATPAAVGKEYIEYLERKNKSKVVELSVRYKNPNWTPPFLRAVFENGKSYCKEFYETEYGYAFDRMKREACYTCRFKGDNHLSDITIGDGWGISKDDPGYNPAGVSVAFVHSEAGDSLLKELDDIVLFEGDPEELKRSNPRYLTPKPKLQKDEPFRINFQKYGLLKACKKAYSLKKRILNATPEALLKSLRQIKRLVKK